MEQKSQPPSLLLKGIPPWSIGVLVVIACGSLAFSAYQVLQRRSAPPVVAASPSSSPVISAVSALGRLEPKDEVIRLSASSSRENNRLQSLFVKQGDRVKTGQVIAILDNHESLKAALHQAQRDVVVAEAELESVKAGAKAGELAAQKALIARLEAELSGERTKQQATIARLQADLDNAEAEFVRYDLLFEEGAVAASRRDAEFLRLETARKTLEEAKANLTSTTETLREQINEAKATLEEISEVRPTDVRTAEAKVSSAKAAVLRVQAELDNSTIKSPIDGRVMKVNTRPGESVDEAGGVVELGHLDQMYVVAEVYETDIDRIHLGQMATITSNAFPNHLRGTVDEIGLKIGKQNVLNDDPAANQDARVVEVKIRLDDASSRQVEGLTNLQVEVEIQV